MTVIRGMHKFDALPADDLGLSRVIAHYYLWGRKDHGLGGSTHRRKDGQDGGLAGLYLIMTEQLAN